VFSALSVCAYADSGAERAAEQPLLASTCLNPACVTTQELATRPGAGAAPTFSFTSCVDVSLTLLHCGKGLRLGARVHLHAYTLKLSPGRALCQKQVVPGGLH